MERKIGILAIIVSILVSANVYFLIFSANIKDPGVGPAFNAAQAYIASANQASYLPLLNASAGDVQLDAKSAIVYDVKSDKNLYEKNTDQRLPIASLTKILNAVVVWENLDPSAVVTVAASAVKVDGQRQDLFVDETISVNSLMKLMLIESSNDAAYALRDFAKTKGIDLVSQMNAKALSLGMHDTHFVDPAGLDDDGYSTASDLVKAVHYALKYDAIWDFSREKTAIVASTDGKFSHDIKSTDELLNSLSGIIGGKTGYTDSALGCMMLIVDTSSANVASPSAGDDAIISIILGSHGRFEDMTKLVQWTRSAYRWQ